jgi:iron complex outermembrane receptor protein
MPINSRENLRLRLAVQAALTGGALAASFGVANAQTAPAPTDTTKDASLSEVVVTGSRIAIPNDTSISPVTTINAVTIQQTGVTRIEDLLNSLPQVYADQSSGISNGSDGTATVNLRNLGAQRTLVLVNGRRLGPGDPGGGSQSDLNEIPADLVENIELLTGGASSVYGADAVAGVVNFKLNDHFEGVKLTANAGIYQHHNDDTQGVQTALNDFNTENGANFPAAPSNVNTGATKDLSFLAGLNSPDGNGNATFYATYRDVAAVLQSKYSISACTLASGYSAGSYSTGGKFGCSGSSTSYPGRFLDFNGPGGTVTDYTIGPNGTLLPFGNADRYNYGPLNYFQRPDERYTAGSFLHYDFNEHVTVYSELGYMNDHSVAQIAPSGNFLAPTTFNCANPFLSSAELAAWCGGSTTGTSTIYIGRRNVEGGPRQDDLEHTSWRLVLGAKGKIDDAWDYDTYYQRSIVQLAETYYNDVSSTRVANALNVVTGANGQPECASTAAGLNTNCVPWNIFQLGGVTPAAVNYISVPGLQRGEVNQTVVHADATGDLGKYGAQLPTAASGIKVNVGAEWRDVNSNFLPDEEFQSGDLSGQGGPILPVSGGIISREGFVELRLPLVDDAFLAKHLALESAYRYSDYSLGFKTNTYNIGLEWSPIEELRLRGSFARAVRAPNIGELYSIQSVGNDGVTDPCAVATVGAKPQNYTLAQCERTGETAAQYNNGTLLSNPASQYNGLTGGNPQLGPETALTTSFGVGWQPAYVPGFRVQVDYFDIKIENIISRIGSDTILQDCLNADVLCNYIHRAPGSGSLWLNQTGYVTDLTSNVGQLETKGFDLDLSQDFDVGAFGKVHTNLVGTYVDSFTVTPIESLPSTAYNCAGYYGPQCGTPEFHWRHTLRSTWLTPWHGLDVSAAWRFFSQSRLESLSPNPNLAAAGGGTVANGGISNTDAHIATRSYLDLTASVKLSSNVSLRLGVNNVLDKDPPVIGTSNLPGVYGNGNTFPGVYDALGRYMFATVIAQF